MKNNKTIILTGMPHLKWMTENLTGHGGTGVGGRWYYTWEQAMAAAKELGDGWRLPTAGELQQLSAIGSTWDAKRKGRWFGGNHATDHEGSLFFHVSGYSNMVSCIAYGLGSYGIVWSSTPFNSSSAHAGYFDFYAGEMHVMACDYSDRGFSVRLVREIKLG